MPRGDFPDVHKFKKSLLEIKDISKSVPKLDKHMVKEMDRVLSQDIAKLLEKCSLKVNQYHNMNQNVENGRDHHGTSQDFQPKRDRWAY